MRSALVYEMGVSQSSPSMSFRGLGVSWSPARCTKRTVCIYCLPFTTPLHLQARLMLMYNIIRRTCGTLSLTIVKAFRLTTYFTGTDAFARTSRSEVIWGTSSLSATSTTRRSSSAPASRARLHTSTSFCATRHHICQDTCA